MVRNKANCLVKNKAKEWEVEHLIRKDMFNRLPLVCDLAPIQEEKDSPEFLV